MKLGEYIKAYRDSRGMSMRDFAAHSGLSVGYLSMLENNKNPKTGAPITPSIKTFNAVAAATNTTVNELLSFVDGNISLDEAPSSNVISPSIAKNTPPNDNDLLNTGFSKTKKAPSVSDEAMRMARDYDKLDNWGRQAVRDLTDTELARMEDEARFMNGAMLEDEPKVINLYAEPAAAGIAVPTIGVDFEPYTLKPDDPQGAAFAVRLQGDSMEPYFPDGSIVFVNHDAMVNGDIGIFCVDSGTVCKQYYHDPLGMVYLFSLNRDRSDADVVLGPSSNRTLICQGRVITKRRFPIPM